MSPDSRSPAARLLRARTLVRHWDSSLSTHRYEDPLVLAYAKFLHELSTLNGLQHDRYLALRPVTSELHYLASATDTFGGGRPRDDMAFGLPRLTKVDAPENGASKDRALVKACVLGGATAMQTADLLDFRPETVASYERLAFDVRGRIHKRGWVHNYVFGDSVVANTSALDFERLCLITAYRHGFAGVERLLFLSNGTSDFTDKMREQLRVDMASKAGVSLATIPLNSATIPELLTGYNNWEKTEVQLADSRRGGNGDDPIAQALAGVRQVGFTVHDRPVDSEAQAEERYSDQPFIDALAEVLSEMQLQGVAGD